MVFGQTNTGFTPGIKTPFTNGFGIGLTPVSSTVANLKAPEKVTTYNARYPGFNEEDYKRLEQLVDAQGVSPENKTQVMDEFYQYYYPQVMNKHKLEDRQQEINNYVFLKGRDIANGKKDANIKYRSMSLAQMAKQKFGIAYDVNDDEIIGAIQNSVPNGEKLLTEFLDNGNPEILYQAGIYEEGQTAPDFKNKKDKAKEALRDDFWGTIWGTVKTNATAPINSFKKFAKQHFSRSAIVSQMAKQGKLNGLSEESMNPYIEEHQQETLDYNKQIDENFAKLQEENIPEPIRQYYNSAGATKLLTEGDFKGFAYKVIGDAAQNWEMPVVVAASVANPAIGMGLMATDTYVREYQDAFDNMIANGASYEQAEQGAVGVGLINTAIEMGLETALGGVETTSAKLFRDALNKNVQKEAVKKGLGRVLLETAGTQLRASGEEGLEEVFQTIVQNAFVETLKENPDFMKYFEGVGASFEGGFFNPLNLMALGGNLSNERGNIQQSLNEGAYKAGEGVGTVWNTVSDTVSNTNLNPANSEYLTRTLPARIENNQLQLSKVQRKNIERSGKDAGSIMLEWNIAGLPKEEQITSLERIGNEGYNNVTNLVKDKVNANEMVSNKDGAMIAEIMADSLESSKIWSKKYKDAIKQLREISQMEEIPASTALQLRRDFDNMKGHLLYKADGDLKLSSKEVDDLVQMRDGLNNEINKLGQKYGVDVRAENEKVSQAVTIRDAILENMSKEERANFLGAKELGLSALLARGNSWKTIALIGAGRLAQKKAGNLAQFLYNLNDKPLERKTTQKRGAGFINKGQSDGRFHYGISDSSSNGDILSTTERGVISDVDVGANPLDTIQDKNVGANPTDLNT